MGAKGHTAGAAPVLTSRTYATGTGLPRAAVRVDARGDAALAEWLDDFLRPGLLAVADDERDPVVTVVPADAEPAWQPAGDGDTRSVPCFALDRSVVQHPSRRTDDGTLLVDDESYGTRSFLGPDEVTVVRRDPSPRSRAGVMRVVREIVTARAAANGALQLHAGALERDGRVVLFAGPKEAGKTTLVARLAQLGLAAIAANDRVLVDRNATGAWTTCPVGTVVSVRGGTRALVPALAGPFPEIRSPAHLTVAELDALPTAPAGTEPPGRVTLSPAQFAHALGARRSAGGSLTAVFLLAVDPTVDGYRVARLDPTAAADALTAVEYGNRSGGQPRTVFEQWLGAAPAPDCATRRDALRREVPVSALTTGPRVMHDDGCARALADEVFGA